MQSANTAMKRALFVALCLALLCAGCVEQKSGVGQTKADQNAEKLTATITSPGSGEILKGSSEINFEATVKGGKGPFTYRWSSNIDGVLSTSSSFRRSPSELSKGQHILILTVTDASGASTQSSVIIQVV